MKLSEGRRFGLLGSRFRHRVFRIAGRVAVEERLKVSSRDAELAAQLDRAEILLVDPGAYRLFADLQKLCDFVRRHEWIAENHLV